MAPALKYIVRAIKYFFYFSIIMIVIMSILVLAHVVDGTLRQCSVTDTIPSGK